MPSRAKALHQLKLVSGSSIVSCARRIIESSHFRIECASTAGAGVIPAVLHRQVSALCGVSVPLGYAPVGAIALSHSGLCLEV